MENADKVSALESSLEESRNIADKLHKEIVSKEIENKSKDNSLKEFNQIKDDYMDKCKRYQDENDRLRDDIKLQSNELNSLNSKYRESQSILAESQSKVIPLEYELNKYKNENESLKTRVEELENDLSVITNDSMNQRREHTKKCFDLEAALVEKNTELEQYVHKIRSLQVSAQWTNDLWPDMSCV